ncbi:MAG: hypothetical protein R3C02_21105 [Planctomycetaceae bacterium]
MGLVSFGTRGGECDESGIDEHVIAMVEHVALLAAGIDRHARRLGMRTAGAMPTDGTTRPPSGV